MEPRRNISRNLLVLSLFLNVIFASFSYVTLPRSQELQSHAEDFRTAYNELAEVTKNLDQDQQLNLTRTQLEYYMEDAHAG